MIRRPNVFSTRPRRRPAVSFLAAALLLAAFAGTAAPGREPQLLQELAALERGHGGRLGVAIIDTQGGGSTASYRGDERFPFCSTLKIVLVAQVLKQCADDALPLDRQVQVTTADLVNYSPISSKRVGDSMTVSELCAAAITHSDNTATNLLLRFVGGPESVTAFTRGIGDAVFRLDRQETALNTAVPGDPRDTSSPAAMAETTRKILFGGVLRDSHRDLLLGWLHDSATGGSRIRAGLPSGWTVGDKTGTGDYGTTNDVAVFWPDGKNPVILAVYYTQDRQDAKADNEIVAAVAKLAAASLTAPGQPAATP
jgi:beta-lactamase class A